MLWAPGGLTDSLCSCSIGIWKCNGLYSEVVCSSWLKSKLRPYMKSISQWSQYGQTRARAHKSQQSPFSSVVEILVLVNNYLILMQAILLMSVATYNNPLVSYTSLVSMWLGKRLHIAIDRTSLQLRFMTESEFELIPTFLIKSSQCWGRHSDLPKLGNHYSVNTFNSKISATKCKMTNTCNTI